MSFPKFIANSDTSYAAAVASLDFAQPKRELVLAFLRTVGAATDEQIQRALRMNPSTQRPRRIELVQAGLVRDSGQRALTASGSRAVLWECVEPTGQMELMR